MSASSIEWTHPPGFDGETWNPTLGCDKVSPGCKFCYAIRSVNRMAGNPNAKIAAANAGLVVMTGAGLNWTGKVNSIESRLSIPLKKNKPTAYFVNSLSDLFHKEIADEFIDKVFAVMALTPQHRYMILTKRPERMLAYIDSRAKSIQYWEDAARSLGFTFRFIGADWNEHSTCPFPLPNCWLGVSVENQATADARIPILIKTPAAIRFVSYEPALGPVDFTQIPISSWKGVPVMANVLQRASIFAAHLDLVITGGESGPGARPFNIAWAQQTINQCAAAGISCFIKQFGAKPVFQWSKDADAVGLTLGPVYDDQMYPVRLKDRKGGSMEDWPEWARVRQYPT